MNIALPEPSPDRQAVELRNSWLSRHKTALVLGAAALSTAVTLVGDPMSETKDHLLDAAPWVGTGLIAGEVCWIGGAAMMLAAVGDRVGRNPLKIRERLSGIAQKANNSRLFQAGFWLNYSAAIAQTSVMTAGIVSELPVHSWGWLAIPATDLWVTLSARRLIYNGMRRSDKIH